MCDELRPEPLDSLMLLTPELRQVAKRIMPCAEEISPENFRTQSGGFRECATWGAQRIGELGPGLVNENSPVEPGSDEFCGFSCLHVTAGLCGWTWATIVKLDGYKRVWPDPFAGQDRIEIEVVCR